MQINSFQGARRAEEGHQSKGCAQGIIRTLQPCDQREVEDWCGQCALAGRSEEGDFEGRRDPGIQSAQEWADQFRREECRRFGAFPESGSEAEVTVLPVGSERYNVLLVTPV